MGSRVPSKLKRPNTSRDTERITALEEQLREQVAEHRRLRRELEELRRRSGPASPPISRKHR